MYYFCFNENQDLCNMFEGGNRTLQSTNNQR